MELLSGCLNDNSYLAHICAGKKSESLKEHLEKVAEYACLLVKSTGWMGLWIGWWKIWLVSIVRKAGIG
nr:hypothetical protein [Odoribacter sp. OF09-27XD]